MSLDWNSRNNLSYTAKCSLGKRKEGWMRELIFPLHVCHRNHLEFSQYGKFWATYYPTCNWSDIKMNGPDVLFITLYNDSNLPMKIPPHKQDKTQHIFFTSRPTFLGQPIPCFLNRFYSWHHLVVNIQFCFVFLF